MKEDIIRVWTDTKEGFDYVSKEMYKFGEDECKKSKEDCNIEVLLEDVYKEEANYWANQEDEYVNYYKEDINDRAIVDDGVFFSAPV